MNKSFTLLLSLSLLSSLQSCNTSFSSDDSTWLESSYDRILDEDEKNAVFQFPLEYELFIPGNDVISYNVLWTGYNSENSHGPKISKEERFYTYLTDYEENKDSYYLVYLKKQDLTSFPSWYESYSRNHESDDMNYHFMDDKDVIDGKYLLYAQKNHIDDCLVLEKDRIDDVSFSYQDYQLSLCLQKNTLTIEKNVSLNITLDRKISLLRRYELLFDKETSQLKRYSFDGPEKTNTDIIDSLFSYHGKRLEAYPKSFEEMSYCYCPFIGLWKSGYISTKRADIQEEGILLPHYRKTKEESIDLLHEDTDFSATEDIYRSFKSLFLSAYI